MLGIKLKYYIGNIIRYSVIVILLGIKLLVMELWSLPVLDREVLRNCIRTEFILVSPVCLSPDLEGAGGNLNAVFVHHLSFELFPETTKEL